MAVFTIKALASALAVFGAFATGVVADELPELPQAALCMFSFLTKLPSPSLTCIQLLRPPLTRLSPSSMASPPLTVRDTPFHH